MNSSVTSAEKPDEHMPTEPAKKVAAEPSKAGGRRQLAKRLSTVIGTLLALGGAAFVTEKIVSGWSEYGAVVAGARWAWLAPALLCGIAGMSTMGLLWRRIVTALGAKARWRDTFVWYQLGNLGKYLPGGIWPLFGRSELAVRGGVFRSAAYNSVALSMGSTRLCAIVVCAVLLPFVVVDETSIGLSMWAFALIPLGFALLHPAILGRALRVAVKVLGRGVTPIVPPWGKSVGLVLQHTPGWLLIGTSAWFVALAFAPGAPVLTVVFAGIASWVAGYVVMVAPAGIGVREAAFTAVAATVMPGHVAATIAVVARLVMITSDAAGAAIALPLSRTSPVTKPAGKQRSRRAGA